MRSTLVHSHRTATTVTERLVVTLSETQKIVLTIETTTYERGQRKIRGTIKKPGDNDIPLPPLILNFLEEFLTHGTTQKEGWVDGHGREIEAAAPESETKDRELVPA